MLPKMLTTYIVQIIQTKITGLDFCGLVSFIFWRGCRIIHDFRHRNFM